MKLGLMVGYSGAKLEIPLDLVQEADSLGYDSVWISEAYGSDVIVPLTWIGAHTQHIKLGTAILQIPARTPAITAMTAMSLDQLTNGRMLLGLGVSGPQVIEGWHGVSYAKPLTRTREYIAILRQIFAREAPMSYSGSIYQIPYSGEDATGLGKPLKSILHGRADLPIYIASIGPKNVELTAEIADGWLPIFFSPERYTETYHDIIEAGFAKSETEKTMDDFAIVPTVNVAMGDDLESCYNQLRPLLALYIGGMGARDKNFYNELACRYGYEAQAKEIQDLFLSGKKGEAMMAVPTELIDEVSLAGPKERIQERLSLWKDSPVSTLNIATLDIDTLRVMAELVL